jgi:hypothetical protein
MSGLDRFDAFRESVKRAAARKAKRTEKRTALGWSKKPKKVTKAKLRKRLIVALDKEFSEFIRGMFTACPFCGRPVEHCFHFVTRAKYSVRWDERNAVGSCAGCNYRYEFDPHFAIQWFIAFRGLPAYEQLIQDGNKIKKWDNADLEARLNELRKLRSLLQSLRQVPPQEIT